MEFADLPLATQDIFTTPELISGVFSEGAILAGLG
jgi:hypothetical protein